jgi:hypothetical protein
MSKNNKVKKKAPKIYSKEVKKNLEDLEWQKAQFHSNRVQGMDSVMEMKLKIEYIKYLKAELANYQKEVNILRQSIKENEGKTETA